MNIPSAAAVTLTGYSPRLVIDTRLVPGEANLMLQTTQADVQVDQRELLTDLPYMLATFSERRRIIRQTLDEVRDVIIQSRDTDIYLVLELDGWLYDARSLTGVTLECTSSSGSNTTIDLSTSPTVFDFSQKVVVRGQTINPLVLKFTAAAVASFFSAGIWTVEVFGADVDHTNGTHWGTIEFEVRSLFEGVFITPLTGALNFITANPPQVTYRNLKPATVDLALTGYAPTLAFSGRITPSTGAIVLGSDPPTTPGRIIPPSGVVALSGVAPLRTP